MYGQLARSTKRRLFVLQYSNLTTKGVTFTHVYLRFEQTTRWYSTCHHNCNDCNLARKLCSKFDQNLASMSGAGGGKEQWRDKRWASFRWGQVLFSCSPISSLWRGERPNGKDKNTSFFSVSCRKKRWSYSYFVMSGSCRSSHFWPLEVAKPSL